MANLAFDQFLMTIGNYVNLESYFSNPNRLYASAGSMFMASAIGGAYGLIGRVVYPKAGIYPLHYAIWFTLAFQIKYCIEQIEKHYEKFMGVSSYLEGLENIPEDEWDLQDQIRYHCWKVIQLKNASLKIADEVFSNIFHIRPYLNIKPENVQEASFLEMCRYRIWNVFKITLLDSISSILAYRLTNAMGFSLPNHTAVPLFIVMRSVAKDILLLPSLYVYARICNQLADHFGEGDQRAAKYRVVWISRCLPSL